MMGIKRIFAATVALAVGVAVQQQAVQDVLKISSAGKDNKQQAGKDSIYAMPNAHAQYYKKHQHGIR
tara:strand:+ start:4416 stop:4616 length:201 start_codon:yes stop_codon:yes gene_type:complete